MEKWKWFGRPKHFIGAINYSFRMGTMIGKYIISTVGEYRPLNHENIEDIGHNRKYETMVFKGKKCKCGCNDYVIMPNKQIDLFRAYNDFTEAENGHIEICLEVERMIERGEL